MKKAGVLLIALGFYCVILAFNIDVVVGTTYNIGLLNDRQNIVYLSGILFLSGIMLLGFGFVAKEETKNLKGFALWIFFTPMALLIDIKVVYMQEKEKQEVIVLEQERLNKEEQERLNKEAEAKKAAQAKILKENSDKFVDNKDGTITFKKTGLMWQRCSVGQTWTGKTCEGYAQSFTWYDAMKLTSKFAGHNDWRLPTQEELKGLVYCSDGKIEKDDSCSWQPNLPTINTTVFPKTKTSMVWSSSPHTKHLTEDELGYYAQALNLGLGYGSGKLEGLNKNGNFDVRLVRN